MKKAKYIYIYGVLLVTSNNMKELFRSEHKELCQQFRRNNSKLGTLKIGVVGSRFEVLNNNNK